MCVCEKEEEGRKLSIRLCEHTHAHSLSPLPPGTVNFRYFQCGAKIYLVLFFNALKKIAATQLLDVKKVFFSDVES